SPIQSDKPVSVWGGSSCMNIPVGVAACDSAHQQLLPISALGHEYLAVRYRDRAPGANEVVPYTLVGAADGTILAFDPPIPGAPSTLSSGQVALVTTSEAFFVQSQDEQHPFYLAAHMTGEAMVPETPGTDPALGDPDFVNVVPPEQYLSNYLFLTDPTYG